MKHLSLMTLLLLVTACATSPSGPAVCDGLIEAARTHAHALADSPHDPSVLSGDALLSKLKAGCQW